MITVQDLINALSKYPMDKEVKVTHISENIKGELVLVYKRSKEGQEALEDYIQRKEKEREEERRGKRTWKKYAYFRK